MRRAAVLQALLSIPLVCVFSIVLPAQDAAITPTQKVLISCIPKHEPVTLTFADLSSRELTLKSLTPAGPDAAFDYMVLFDISHSVHDDKGTELANASALLHTLARSGRDRGAAIVFAETPIAGGFVTDPEVILAALRTVRTGRGTALFDAVFLGATKLAELPDRAPRYMFIVSDGEDTWSRALRDEALGRALASGTQMIAVTPVDSNFASRGDKVLELFARTTGGLFLRSGSGDSEEKVKRYSRRDWERLESFFKYRYWLEFEPNNPNAKVLHPELKTHAKCELIAPEVVANRPLK